jgi:hypothetical protein
MDDRFRVIRFLPESVIFQRMTHDEIEWRLYKEAQIILQRQIPSKFLVRALRLVRLACLPA